jgi:hypothetical protein
MLTPFLANRVSLALRSTSAPREAEFGGKTILLVGDLLQLPPVVHGFSTPVLRRLITRLSCWDSIQKFCLKTHLRTSDLNWAEFLVSLVVERIKKLLTWYDLAKQFGVTVTDDIQVAQTFFCTGVWPDEQFHLDRQWICPTNKLAGQVNDYGQQWRSAEVQDLGTRDAITELVIP